MKLGTLIKQAREKVGLSHGDVAGHLGYFSPQFVSNWERGLAEPPLAAWKTLCYILKIEKKMVRKILLDRFSRELDLHLGE